MASNILNILSKTSQINIQDVLKGVVHTAAASVKSSERHYDQLDKCAMLEMVNFISETLSEHSETSREEDLVRIVDDVCLPVLPDIEAFVFGSKSRHLGLDSQLYQAVCQLLALCTVTSIETKSESASVSVRLLEECISAFSAYKEESDLISGGTGAQVTSDKHLSIHAALAIVDNIFERQAKVMTKDKTQSINSEWIQICFDSILSIIETSQTNVCTRLTAVILPKMLLHQPNLLQSRCSKIWNKIVSIYSTGKQDTKAVNTNVFITLCGLVNYFIPYGAVQETDNSFSVTSRIELWRIIQSGLIHSDPLARKQSLFLLKRVIDWYSTSGSSIKVLEGENGPPVFAWMDKDKKHLVNMWADFFLLYETLQEVQVRQW